MPIKQQPTKKTTKTTAATTATTTPQQPQQQQQQQQNQHTSTWKNAAASNSLTGIRANSKAYAQEHEAAAKRQVGGHPGA